MNVINKQSNNNINAKVEPLDSSKPKKFIPEERGMSFLAKSKVVEEEEYCCFILGYN